MTTSPQASTPPEPTLTEERERLWQQAVTTLTSAVRLRHPTEGPLDFADFLASALAAVAGNVGSIDRMTAGRPGSWESAGLNRLLIGSLGEDDPDNLLAARTEPVIVQLNVAQLVSEARDVASAEQLAKMLPDLDAELDALEQAMFPEEEVTEAQEQAWEAADADLRRRYAKAYETYAQRFTAAVRDVAADLPALKVPVEVRATTDPEASWWSPGDVTNTNLWLDEDEQGDELASQLWAAARVHVGLPALEEPSGD